MKQYIFSYIAVSITAMAIFPLYGMNTIVHTDNFLKDKLVNKKEFSLEQWKNYRDNLIDLKQMSLNRCDRQAIREKLRYAKEKIILKETQLKLKEITARIRETKYSSIEDLCTYKKILKQYISLLPKSYPQKKDYDNTLYFVIHRIGILTQIDICLQTDYNAPDIKTLEYLINYLSELQKQLNDPYSERHKQLTEKIEYMSKLTKPNLNHESLVSCLLAIIVK